MADWWQRKQSNITNKRRRKAFNEAAERGEGRMTAQQEGRLLEMFHENNPLLHHGGKASNVGILNCLGDGHGDAFFELSANLGKEGTWESRVLCDLGGLL